MKQVFKWLLCGAMTTLGGIIMKEVVEVSRDPYKMALIKSKFNKITHVNKKAES